MTYNHIKCQQIVDCKVAKQLAFVCKKYILIIYMCLQNAHATYYLSILTHLDKVDPGNNTNSQPIMH